MATYREREMSSSARTRSIIIIVYYATEAAHIIHYTNIQHKTQKIKTSKTIHNTETKFRYQQSEQIHSTLPS